MTQSYDPTADFDQPDELSCEKCGEPGDDLDPVAHFKHPERFGDYVMAHGQCGEDFELELA